MQISTAADLFQSPQFARCNHASWRATTNRTKTRLIRRERREVSASHQSCGGLTGWLTDCWQDLSSWKQGEQYYVYPHPLNLPFSQALSTCENKTTPDTSVHCTRSGLEGRQRGFKKRRLDLLCDTFTAGLLAVYTEGKQLGIGVSCFCVNRCSINHAGTANTASTSWGPSLHPAARKCIGCRPEERTDPESEGHSADHPDLVILWVFTAKKNIFYSSCTCYKYCNLYLHVTSIFGPQLQTSPGNVWDAIWRKVPAESRRSFLFALAAHNKKYWALWINEQQKHIVEKKINTTEHSWRCS